jgi:hypothetical protein
MRCGVGGCDRDAAKTGLCNAHYIRRRRHGDVEALKIERYTDGQVCDVDGCPRPVLARRYCRPHYERLMAHGDPRGGPAIRADVPPRPQPVPRQPVDVRFWSKVDRSGDCWLWTGQKTRAVDGYGRFRFEGRQVMAYRWSYEQENGPVPEGLELDHLCRTRLCVRPDHLEAVTPSENVRRAFRAKTQKALAVTGSYCSHRRTGSCDVCLEVASDVLAAAAQAGWVLVPKEHRGRSASR